jgi:hypothetical protein
MLLVHGIMDSSHAWVAGGAASGLGFRYVAIAAVTSAALLRPFSRYFLVGIIGCQRAATSSINVTSLQEL